MAPPRPRPIPLAAAALTLSFGGCEKSHAPSSSSGGGSTGDAGAASGGNGSTGGTTGGTVPGASRRPPDGSGAAFDAATDQYLRSYCELLSRCYPDAFNDYFVNGAECIRYYDDYFGGYYTYLLEVASNPVECETAMVDMLDCYIARFEQSCDEALYNGYYCEPGYYYAYYDYYYGGYTEVYVEGYCGYVSPGCASYADIYYACR